MRFSARTEPTLTVAGVPSTDTTTGDFLSRCRPTDSCFSLGAFVHAVADLRARLLAEKDVAVAHVVLATDETDPAFLAQVDALEWVRVGEDVSLEIRRSLGDW